MTCLETRTALSQSAWRNSEKMQLVQRERNLIECSLLLTIIDVRGGSSDRS